MSDVPGTGSISASASASSVAAGGSARAWSPGWAIGVAGATGAIIGGAYLAAWMGGLARRWSATGVLTMKTNMSLSLVLAGGALLLLDPARVTAKRRAWGAVAAALVLLIGALTLSEHLLQLDLGIDQLLATEAPGAIGTASPNRVGPPGSTCLVLLGAGLLALAWRRRAAFYPGLLASLTVLVPAVGFLYGITRFYGGALTGIAWPTVLALLSLSGGLMLADAERGPLAVLWRSDPGGVLLRRLLLPSVAIPLVLGWLRIQGERHGLYGFATGTGLFAISVVLVMSVLLWRSAEQLSAAAAQRQRAVEQLADEKERLAVTLRSIGDAVIATDEAARVTVFNAVAEALTGWRSEEAVGRPLHEVFQIVNEVTRRPAPSPVERVLREGVVVGLANHTALVARDGTERPIADSGAPIRDAGGRISGVVLVFRDQTEARRAEEALKVSEGRYRNLFDNMTEEVHFWRVVRDAAGRIETWRLVDANPPALSTWGRKTLDEIRGKTTDEIFGPGATEHYMGVVRKVMEEGVPLGFEDYFPNLDRYFRFTTIPLGEHFITTGADITAIKKAQLVLEEHNAELREAARRKDEFLGMLSHELRNPLAPIRNSVYILEHANPAGEQAARARQVIQRQTEHLTRLVDDLLDVTRIARGKIELRRERVDLREIALRTAEDLRSTIESRGVAFSVEMPEARTWADGDETRIAQVIGNLLQNAAKFTRRGDAVALSLRTAGGEAEISVKDSGAGIDPRLLPDLFQPFVQGDRTLARSEGGLGLGLALVKAITGLHGGTVRAESAGTGKGAEFVIRLPLVAAARPDGAVVASERRGRAPRRVLVVDDNHDAADSLAAIVEAFGHTVEVAYDGPSAVERARATSPDIVLCDIGLPGMSGYEVARTLRAGGVRTQLIAVSGYAQADDVRKALEAGFDQHVAKPPDLAELERLLA